MPTLPSGDLHITIFSGPFYHPNQWHSYTSSPPIAMSTDAVDTAALTGMGPTLPASLTFCDRPNSPLRYATLNPPSE